MKQTKKKKKQRPRRSKKMMSGRVNTRSMSAKMRRGGAVKPTQADRGTKTMDDFFGEMDRDRVRSCPFETPPDDSIDKIVEDLHQFFCNVCEPPGAPSARDGYHSELSVLLTDAGKLMQTIDDSNHFGTTVDHANEPNGRD